MTRKLALLASFGLIAGLAQTAKADDAPPTPPPAPTTPATGDATTPPPPADAAKKEEEDKKKKAAATEGETPVSGGATVGGATPAGGGSVTVTIGSTPEGETKKDEATKTATPAEDEASKKKSPWRGTMLLFDQSMTTDSFSKGARLSYQPLYEWWISPRVYYSVGDHIKFGARFDFFKEMFTNHEETTAAREWRYGDPWLTASYSDEAKFLNKNPKTRWAVGLTLRPPLSKDSRANGQYFALGPSASLTFGYDIRGEKAKNFQGGSIAIAASYSHAFTKYTTPVPFGDFCRPHQDAGGQIYDCKDNLDTAQQLRSGTITGNSIIYSLSAGVDILENLDFSASYIVINGFSYTPSEAKDPNGNTITRSDNDTRFRQSSWFLLSLGYEPIKEVSLSLGYYNLNTVLGLDGKYRNPLWSPESRVFLSATAHLDTIYETITNKKKEEPKSASNVSKFLMFR